MSPPRDCVPALSAAGLHVTADWAEERPIRHGWKGRTCRDLWDDMPRGDWLLAWAESTGVGCRDLVRAAAACVRPALRFVPDGDDRPRQAVEAAERWAERPTERNRRRAERAGQAAWQWTEGAAWTMSPFAQLAWAAADSGMGCAGQAIVAAEEAPYHGVTVEAEFGAKDVRRNERACADAVRRLVPFLELPAGAGR